MMQCTHILLYNKKIGVGVQEQNNDSRAGIIIIRRRTFGR